MSNQVYTQMLPSYNLRIPSFTRKYSFIRPRICPLYSCHRSPPQTKLLHFALSPVSSCATPWSLTPSLAPSVHLSLCVSFHHVPLESHLEFSRKKKTCIERKINVLFVIRKWCDKFDYTKSIRVKVFALTFLVPSHSPFCRAPPL